MAMPASGSIAILNNALQTCSSIAQAVDGNVTPPKSLSTLGTTAGITPPTSMSNFYGYGPIAVDMLQLFCSGTDGGSILVRKCHCICTSSAMAVGDSYTLCLCANLHNTGVGSTNFVCVTCNTFCKFCCCITNPTSSCATPSTSFIVDDNDAVVIHTCGSDASGGNNVGTWVCLFSVTSIVGTYAKGTTCTCYCTWTN